MGSPTCLTDPASLVVIDTSVAINLMATGRAAEILAAVPNRIIAVDVVPFELEEGRRLGRPDADLLQVLATAGQIETKSLGEEAMQMFMRLVVGPAAATLDDGEAATIAYAAIHGAVPFIDERKARRLCAERFPALRAGSTTDLFAHPQVLRVLGRADLASAVSMALQQARMRVLPHHVEWVIDLIGEKEAALCTSLPRSVRTRKAVGL